MHEAKEQESLLNSTLCHGSFQEQALARRAAPAAGLSEPVPVRRCQCCGCVHALGVPRLSAAAAAASFIIHEESPAARSAEINPDRVMNKM